jgi:hypothetical protein
LNCLVKLGNWDREVLLFLHASLARSILRIVILGYVVKAAPIPRKLLLKLFLVKLVCHEVIMACVSHLLKVYQMLFSGIRATT